MNAVRGKTWRKEEVEYLNDSWGAVRIQSIADKLNRSLNSVKLKAHKLGLGDARFHFDGITLFQLSYALGTSYSVLRGWVKKYEFPAQRKVFTKTNRVAVVRFEDFWKWAEVNKAMIDFSRMEKNTLGPEPEWVTVKRDADTIKKRHIKKSHNHSWSDEEDRLLRSMINAYRFSYPEIAGRIKRSEGAVKRRLKDLGIKGRPVRMNNHVKYSSDEVVLMEQLLDAGYCLEDIATRINKSALGVRGKFERMGYTFMNGVPSKKAKVTG